ncbi:MAG: non-ribosomal peptide synthetase, partial [Syntrophothermus sp.]
FSHFCLLTENIINNGEITLSQLKLVSQDERLRMKLLSEGESRQLPFSSVVSLIENTAAEHAGQTAVVFKRTKLNYRDLNLSASKAARLLAEYYGIKTGDPVCIMLDRSESSVIMMLAVLKAGGIYTPLDPDYPKNRIEYILKDCGSRILITSEKYKNEVSFGHGNILTVEEIREKSADYSGENLNIMISPDSAGYIIYTSGSTGEPKGVMGTHKCLLNLISWQLTVIGEGLKTLQYAPHIFDVSVQEILFSLSSGGTLYLIENETRYKMSLLSEIIEEEGIEILTMPYSALNLFLGETENFSSLRSLKHLITSGEQPFINSHLEKLLKMYPALRFHNQYGPSETHVVSSYTADGTMPVLPEKVPMGRPVSNTQLYVLDGQMEFVSRGMQGDLYIGGDNVACGYINRRELTDERFIQNPIGPGRLYKSGDLARWNFDNELEYLGRNDGQVKVRGFRIELGEIEACLLKYPDIKEAAVKLTDDDENKEIVAYFASQTEIITPVLREFLFSNLPSYMVPGYFVKIDAFPRTTSGKIDLKGLPEPEKITNPDASDHADPTGETEIIIAEVWKEILKRDTVSSNDNFFELGGNSIKAIQVMSKVQKRLGKKTYLNLIFQQPTIRKMAGTILDTEERLKNLDADTALLNGEHEKKIFFLPPGIGYSFAYMEYAKYFDDCSVYGLNFIESLSPVKSMADIMTGLQPEGKIYLFGHSAGGNMAYDTALELQKQGREIGGLVLLDTYRQLELIDWSPEEYLEDAVLYIEQNHAEFLDEQIKDAALKKIVAYRRYLNSRIEDIKVDFPIIQIEAGGDLIKFKQRISRSAWGELTPHYEVFEGAGGHMDMLKQPNLKKNALLTKKLFDNLFINHSAAAF